MCQITLHIINPIVVKTRRHADAGCAIFRHFPSDTLIYGIPRDSSKNFNIHTCEHMILGQLRMGARQTKNAAKFLTKRIYEICAEELEMGQLALFCHQFGPFLS